MGGSFMVGLVLIRRDRTGTSLAVQWLRLRASTARGMGSIPGQGTKIPHATWHGQKIKKKKKRRRDRRELVSHQTLVLLAP